MFGVNFGRISSAGSAARGSRLAFGVPEVSGSKAVRTASSDPRAALLEVPRELMQEEADVGNEADRLR